VQQAAEFEICGRVLDPDFGKVVIALSNNVQNFSVTGAIDHAGAIERLRAADVFVCASRDEAMPTVTLLEAMSLGKAIITTAVGGGAEFVSNGQNALVVPPENSAGMAAAIRSLIEDPMLVRKLGTNARAAYEKQFTMERFGAEFLARVRQALDHTAIVS
jgi:glycosyltransferase involved in cell wall biosynthesis